MASSPTTSLSLSLDSLFSPNHHLSPSSLPFPSSSSSSSSSSSFRKTHNFFPIKSLQTPQTQAPNNNNPFLDPISIHRRNTLKSFNFTQEFNHGSLRIRPMNPEETEPTVGLLTESFAESLWTYDGYVKLLEFFVRQYVLERRNLVPHSVMLVGFYKEEEENGEGEGGREPELACTAEVSFDARGAIAAPPTPLPPKNCPYICNMTVKKRFRRRGIGRQLLKACEELISQMKTIREVYLHCRMIDTVPFEMYKKAGYDTVRTDSILVWLSCQRRKHLMHKELPPWFDSQWDVSDSEDHPCDKI